MEHGGHGRGQRAAVPNSPGGGDAGLTVFADLPGRLIRESLDLI
jgi:hypothetical protein